ncbi:unnamed protein product [Urochloa decumbens]|uniref:Uncharacterized protein n=1 Tax=Urochloa decumbens TaxID=240449 RepID=A0ABC9E748_9POAL
MASTTAIYIGLFFLTGNSILAINRSWGDAAAVIFVIASYLSLVHLFYCLRWFEASPQGSAARDKARLGVWLTTTLLTAMFSWRVAAVMPRPVAAGVLFMGGSTIAGGFYALFMHRPRGD